MTSAFNPESVLTKLMSLLVLYAPSILLAIATYYLGMKLIRWGMEILDSRLQKQNVEPSMQGFVLSVCGVVMKLQLLISVAGILGVETTPFVAMIGAAGLAIGLAFKDTLGNFAASFLILTFKPFRIGDVVELDGRVGVVKEIQMFCTVITTPDNKTVILPNGPIANGTIVNLSREAMKRIDLTFGIGYGDSIEDAKKALQRVIDREVRVLDEPGSTIAVKSLGDSSVNLVFRVWVKTEDFWDVQFSLIEQAKLELDKSKVSIPFPQRDVHVFQMS